MSQLLPLFSFVSEGLGLKVWDSVFTRSLGYPWICGNSAAASQVLGLQTFNMSTFANFWEKHFQIISLRATNFSIWNRSALRILVIEPPEKRFPLLSLEASGKRVTKEWKAYGYIRWKTELSDSRDPECWRKCSLSAFSLPMHICPFYHSSTRGFKSRYNKQYLWRAN